MLNKYYVKIGEAELAPEISTPLDENAAIITVDVDANLYARLNNVTLEHRHSIDSLFSNVI